MAKLFEKISSAAVPDAFTHSYLHNTLGLKSTTDRPLVPFLRTLGFIDASGKPTPAYFELKNDKTRGRAIAAGVRKAYRPLFDSDENANALPNDELKGGSGQVADVDKGSLTKIMGPLNALIEIADFSTAAKPKDRGDEKADKDKEAGKAAELQQLAPLRADFHFNIQVHLPANATEESYLSMFTALRKASQ